MRQRLAIQRSFQSWLHAAVHYAIQLVCHPVPYRYTCGFFLCSARIACRSSLTSVMVGRSAGSCCHIRSSSCTTSVPHLLRMANIEGLFKNVRGGPAGETRIYSPKLLGTNRVNDPELIPVEPRILLPVRCPSAQHFPVYHSAAEHINLVVISRLRMPQLRRLPIDSADQGTDDRSRGILDASETKVADFTRALLVDQDVRGLALGGCQCSP